VAIALSGALAFCLYESWKAKKRRGSEWPMWISGSIFLVAPFATAIFIAVRNHTSYSFSRIPQHRIRLQATHSVSIEAAASGCSIGGTQIVAHEQTFIEIATLKYDEEPDRHKSFAAATTEP
jgi:hypothetical protein